MKVRHKIFISILLTVLSSMVIFGSVLIYENHKKNLQREQERSRLEIDLYIGALENAMELLGDRAAVLEWYNLQYRDRGITFSIYDQNDAGTVFNLGNMVPKITLNSEDEKILIEPGKKEKCQFVVPKDEKKYLLTTCRMGEERWPVLMYSRDISSIYQQREKNVRQILAIMAVVLAAAGILAGALARYITFPLERLKDDVKQMEEGQYTPREIAGRDEMNELRRSFGKMAKTITRREQELSKELIRRKDFVAAMTHEMNTPLTSVQGYAQFLRNANCSKEQTFQALSNLETEAYRMSSMYEKLRQIYLLEDDLVCKDVFVDELIGDLKGEFSLLLQEKQITVEEELRVLHFRGDKTMLWILLCNLVKNAVNYSEQNSKIKISTDWEGDHICRLRVQDWGVGIPNDQIEKVTEPFYRVDKSRSRATGGTGLGLYLCRQIAEKLQGEIVIESQEGKGTTVSVLLPVKD